MKRRVENDDGESNKRQKKSIINISYFNYLSQDNYNVIFQQTGDYRALFPLLFVSKTFNTFTKQFLNNNYNNEVEIFYYASLFCNYLGGTNQIDLLKWLYSINCLFSQQIFYIVSSNNNDNNLDLLKWLLKIFEKEDSILKKVFIKKYKKEEYYLEEIVYGATQENNQNILEFVKEIYLSTENGEERYLKSSFQSIRKIAAKKNQLTLLKPIIDSQQAEEEDSLIYKIFFHRETNHEKFLLKASKHGSLEILKFYIKKIMPKCRHITIDKRLFPCIFDVAFQYGHVKIMEWLISKEYIDENSLFKNPCWNLCCEPGGKYYCNTIIIFIASTRSLEWSLSKGFLSKEYHGPKLFRYAAEKGRIDFLNILKSYNFEYNDSTCAGAASGGSLECLQWAIENGHPTSF
jgi:hypothetical protein